MPEDIFDKLKERLKEMSWPTVYMFKFILPANNKEIALVENLFSDDASISHHSSSKGNYISITVKQVMLSPEKVIEIYQEASKIKGLMAF